jgi:16S rRNA (guanine527-N7)-methyltransferase
VETARIAELLEPYLTRPRPASTGSLQALSQGQLKDISIYIDILLRWNSRINLTAVREPEEIVRRHFGESLFTALYLFPEVDDQPSTHIIDVGSGAGFPGLPIKLWFPQARVTLIESNHKKAAFLREVIRALTLININVFSGRAEDYAGAQGNVVTLRAVEKFETTLPTAIGLVAPGGRLALLIGESQCQKAKGLKPSLQWGDAVGLPGSLNRALLVGTKNLNEKESE